jgi:precorrin-6B methylase 2
MRPWWPYSAIAAVEAALRHSDSVLEVGGGQSTLWVAKQCAQVWSIEESAAWADSIKSLTQEQGLQNVRIVNEESYSAFGRLVNEYAWDVVIIDGSSDRAAIFETLLRSKNRPRLIIYDDTDRAENCLKNREISGYFRNVYRGFKPQTLYVCETTMLSLVG